MNFHDEAPPTVGETIMEKTVPSNLAAKTPLILGISAKLAELGFVDEANREKVEVCFEEVFTNAIVHGNGSDCTRLVHARLFQTDDEWGLEVRDEGEGFSPDDVPDPDDPDFPWRENGRGIHMMGLIANGVEFYGGGRAVVLTWKLAPTT